MREVKIKQTKIEKGLLNWINLYSEDLRLQTKDMLCWETGSKFVLTGKKKGFGMFPK